MASGGTDPECTCHHLPVTKTYVFKHATRVSQFSPIKIVVKDKQNNSVITSTHYELMHHCIPCGMKHSTSERPLVLAGVYCEAPVTETLKAVPMHGTAEDRKSAERAYEEQQDEYIVEYATPIQITYVNPQRCHWVGRVYLRNSK
jgi:hypothetical protein